MRTTRTKRETIAYNCDRCGTKMPMTDGGYYSVPDGEYAFIAVKAMFYNFCIGAKYNLCSRCTVEIAEAMVKELKKEAE